MDSTDNRIIIRCRKCNQRMFDYISGDVQLEMKCCRCKRVLVMNDVSTTMNIYAEVNQSVTRIAIENLAKNMDVF